MHSNKSRPFGQTLVTWSIVFRSSPVILLFIVTGPCTTHPGRTNVVIGLDIHRYNCFPFSRNLRLTVLTVTSQNQRYLSLAKHAKNTQKCVSYFLPRDFEEEAPGGGGGTWPTNIRGRAAGKSKKLPCPGVKFSQTIPCPLVSSDKLVLCKEICTKSIEKCGNFAFQVI